MVEIYGASWCSFCKSAVKLCESLEIAYKYIDIDESSNMIVLEERMGITPRTVPQIFLDGKYVEGGFTGLRNTLSK